jgi:hypothetical protein
LPAYSAEAMNNFKEESCQPAFFFIDLDYESSSQPNCSMAYPPAMRNLQFYDIHFKASPDALSIGGRLVKLIK